MARVKLERIETSIFSIINIRRSTLTFGLPMGRDDAIKINHAKSSNLKFGSNTGKREKIHLAK